MKRLQAYHHILEVAQNLGLDGYPVTVETCSLDTLYRLAASQFPGRFYHRRFDDTGEQLRAGDDLKKYRLYEIITYSEPCRAFIWDSCHPGEELLLIAHVVAHSDFFKHNLCFQEVPPPPVELFSRHREEIETYIDEFGRREVNQYMDAGLALQDLCHGGIPRDPNLDLLGLLIAQSSKLNAWQKRILEIIREESLYLKPQKETRILNEGWAAFWHKRILPECGLTEAETVAAIKLHAQLMMPVGGKLNPYLVGCNLLEYIAGELGMEKLFSIRAVENDYSLVRKYLTKELLQELDLFLYKEKDAQLISPHDNPDMVKNVLLSHLENGGSPVIRIEDTDYAGEGKLYLRHVYNGLELDYQTAMDTLEHITRLWGRPVLLETVLEGKSCLLPENISL